MRTQSRSIHGWLVSISSADTSRRQDACLGTTRTIVILRFTS
jgi:hypothetical protein